MSKIFEEWISLLFFFGLFKLTQVKSTYQIFEDFVGRPSPWAKKCLARIQVRESSLVWLKINRFNWIYNAYISNKFHNIVKNEQSLKMEQLAIEPPSSNRSEQQSATIGQHARASNYKCYKIALITSNSVNWHQILNSE